MPTILELQQQRAKLVADARAINDKATSEKREMTAEEVTNFDKYMDDSDAVATQIADVRKSEDRSKRLNEAVKTLETRNGRKTDPADPSGEQRDGKVIKFEKRRNPASTHEIRLGAEKRFAALASEEYRDQFRGWLRGEKIALPEEVRNLQMDLDTAGGFLVSPQEFVARLIQQVDDLVYIRRFATVFTVANAATLGVPARDADIADSDWTSELLTGNEDTALTIGKRELQPHPLAKRIKVSNKLLRAGAIDAESLVRDRMAYKFGITQEKAFLSGTGVQQPLGLFTATAQGVSTARDVVTGSSTNFTADGLINAKYKLKPQYWKNGRWMFHRDGIKLIRQLKDTNGQYLWNVAGVGLGQAPIGSDAFDGTNGYLLDFPVTLSEYVPNTFTTGLYVGILGDFSFYWIADALSMQMQRLIELYAATNQTGFIGRMETDGMPVLEEPFVRCITN